MRTSSRHVRTTHANALVLVLALLSVLLSACGSTTSTKTSTTPPPGAAAVTSTLGRTFGMTAAPLHVELLGGYNCADDQYTSGSTANLVLTGDPATYDAAALQRLDKFAAFFLRSYNSDGLAEVPPPHGLAWALGTRVGNGGCTADLEVTNVGTATIQLAQLDARLLATPQPNTQQYREINICSFPSTQDNPVANQCPPGFGAGPGECSIYDASIALHQAGTGSVIVATVTPEVATCPAPTLDPGDTVTLNVSINSIGTPDNLTYAIVPEFVVQDPSGQHILTLNQFATTLTFADPSQYSCYGLQNGALVPVNPTAASSPTWCV